MFTRNFALLNIFIRSPELLRAIVLYTQVYIVSGKSKMAGLIFIKVTVQKEQT